jgi:hypothetical protein
MLLMGSSYIRHEHFASYTLADGVALIGSTTIWTYSCVVNTTCVCVVREFEPAYI